MPISRPAVISFVLESLSIDMQAKVMRVTFVKLLDGSQLETQSIEMLGADFDAFLAANPDSTKSRADDTTYAIYAFAVSKGFIQGTVQ